MSTNFVYSYRSDGQDGRELRYSLRSLEKNWEGNLTLTLVGDRPSWCSREVTWLPRTQLPSREAKPLNILRNYLAGFRHLQDRGERDAVAMDDDYLLVRQASRITPMHLGEFTPLYERRHSYEVEFRQGLENTWHYLRHVPGNVWWYDVHRPLPVEIDKAVRMLSQFENVDPQDAPLWRSLYGNIAGFPQGSVQADDPRFYGSWPQDTDWVSTDERIWGVVCDRVERMFSRPSRFEEVP